MEERDYYLGFSVFPGIGPIKFKLLLDRFETAKSAWNASNFDLKKVLGEKLYIKFDEFRSSFPFNGYKNELKRKDIPFIILTDKDYPQLLKQTPRCPFILYVKGSIDAVIPCTLAIVGTRTITNYGREVTEMFTRELVLAGFTIVSGLALGVDANAHQSTIDANGKTIAVLGCGVDCCTPDENKNLYDQIIKKGGAIVSQFPLGSPPSKGSFPARNRVVAGLSQAVLVTEGAEDSGALITADYAFMFNRPVFAVPGPITSSLSKGPYKLIKKGGKLVTSPEDIIKELKSQTPNSKSQIKSKSQISKFKPETKEEEKILKFLENETLLFDEISIKTGMDSSRLGSLLTMMEVKGMIKSSDRGFSIVLIHY